MEEKVNFFRRRELAIGIVIFGWVASGYLFFRSSQLSKGSASAFDLCQSLFGNSCDEALLNTASWQLGISIISLGLIYFGLLGMLLVIHKPALDRVAILLSAIGVGVSFILSAVIIRKGITCPLCLAVHFINLLALIFILITVGPYTVYRGQKKTTSLGLSIRWGFLILLSFVIGGFSETYILANSIGTRAETSLSQSYEDFQKGTVYKFPVNGLSPISGSANAPLQLVVFSSFQCPGCQVFSNSLRNIKNKFGENINVEYKNFPLSSSCNSKLATNMQPQSCDAALAAIAANKQGLYWKYHDQLFQSNLQGDNKTLLTIAKNIGLNIEKWESDRQSATAKEILLADIQLGNEIMINATPSVFLNGRRVIAFHESSLAYLLQKELHRLSK